MKAASNIFNMVKRFYDNLPQFVKTIYEKEYSNEKMLKFKDQDSQIKIGTAGASSEGRSTTNNYIHLSETAFYDNMETLTSGLLQTVADIPGNYVIFESTANGFNHFRDMFEEGLTKNSKVKSLFYGWQDFDEYRRPIERDYDNKNDFILTSEETELKKAFSLTNEQINWRRNKLLDFKERPDLFKQEYPICWQEAFLNPTDIPLIPIEYIYKAINSNKESLLDDHSPIVVGIDPARTGDRTVMTVRKGRVILVIYIMTSATEREIEGFIINTILPHNPDKIFIDAAYGLDIAKNLERITNIEAVFFSSSPLFKLLYSNRRSEMHALAREWFMQEGGVNMPNNAEVIRELCSIPDMRVDVNGKFHMPLKEEVKKNIKANSPDIMDSLVLTFAKPVKGKRELGITREVEIRRS
jgi:hypothetical protein